MIKHGEGPLYEEAKLALCKLSEVSTKKKPLIQAEERSTEAVEEIMDLLGLNVQPEVIICKVDGEIIEVSTSTPLVMLFGEFAKSLGEGELLPIEEKVLLNQCTFVASLPDRLANILINASWSPKSLEIDIDLFITRISQALCSFLLVIHKTSPIDNVEESFKQKHYQFRKQNAALVCEFMIQTMVRRGYMKVFYQFFILSIRNQEMFSIISEEIIPLVFKAIFKCSFKNWEVSSENMERTLVVRNNNKLYWSEWNSWILQTSEKDSNLKKLLVTSLIRMISFSKKKSDIPNDKLLMFNALHDEIFITQILSVPNERGVLRIIFRGILPEIVDQPKNEKEVDELSEIEINIFKEIFNKWGSHDFVEKGSVELNTTLANAVLYILLHVKERMIKCENKRLPHILLQPLLAGVSERFEIIRSNEMRNEAITVASAFATFFVGEKEALHAFSNLEQFPGLINEWLKGEIDPSRLPGSLQVFNEDLPHNDNDKTKFILCRRNLEEDEFPLDPNDSFTFFCRRDPTVTTKLKLSNTDSVVFYDQNTVNRGKLFSFGKTIHEQDELEDNISILVTLRESYNAIMGIGRSSNAQLHEVQQEIESGLRGLFTALKNIKEKLGIWKEQTVNGEIMLSRKKIGRELNPMIPLLIPTLMTLTIHAPEERHNELMKLRYLNIVSLIIVSPENALNQLSKMLYSAHYGVFQRVEMAKAIGEAAKYLSQVEITLKSQETSENIKNRSNQGLQKRIYPPIPTESTAPLSIRVTEGKETRRWGNAVIERVEKKKKQYSSYLAEVVSFFISTLLAKAEDDHFSFFRDSDPYTPGEVLRTICIIVQCIASARHVAPILCESIMSFALVVVTHHPLLVIRKQGWILIGELMRSWCGAGPLIPSETSPIPSRSVFGGSVSYVFSEKWLAMQQTLQALFEKIKDDPSSAEPAFLVLADMQDLVMSKRDMEVMENRVVNTKKITVAAVKENTIKSF
ncbi:uncharacterized protein TM35_000421150 [Trypanosoma theileri]|uniref:Uncharacterized protein n=1 Tax=Trypanosoma theileri TaxID=67003 RepID=A0A1X0NJ45_9TRYP|nr:uncharacterized protein TM35_000421150 [Trypanosoma theileri]ORC84657.1 hypothetical protein TM35_000421150 [Trypanosoma theileri]